MFQPKRTLLISLLVLLLIPISAFAQTPETIEIGDTASGTLSVTAETQSYTFEAEAGQIVTATLTSEDFDCFLSLLNADGEILATDDDSAGNLDSRISSFEIPTSGTYTLQVSSFGSGAEGDFELTLAESANTRLEYGMNVEGELTRQDTSLFYTFRGDEGDTILITLLSTEGFDTYLNLYQGEDTSFPLISNDDGAGNLNSLIGPYTLPETGTYTVEATSFSRDATGPFTLSLALAEVDVIEIGENVEATLTADDSLLYFQFDANAGDIIDLTLEGGADIGVAMILNGPDGFQVSYSDTYSGSDPFINDFQLSQDGTYTILVRVLEPGREGKVTLSLDRATLASLDEGPQTIEFSSMVTRSSLVFSGIEDAVVTITLKADSTEAISPTLTVTQDGVSVTYVSSSQVFEVSATFAVPQDGEVLVQVDEYSYDDRDVVISLTSAE